MSAIGTPYKHARATRFDFAQIQILDDRPTKTPPTSSIIVAAFRLDLSGTIAVGAHDVRRGLDLESLQVDKHSKHQRDQVQ